MDTTAPIAPIDTETPINTELSDTELEELQHLALSEGCHDPDEAMRSRTAKVVLKRVSNQVFHVTDNEEFNPMVELLRSTYDEFLSKIPITKWEQDTFLSVLQDSKNQQRIKDIVSRLKFAYGRESKTFLTAYMLDQEWDVDPTKLIEYIVDEIENYALVLDEDEENIQELGKVKWIGTYYTCEEKWDGAEKWKKLILVTEEGKMVRYEYVFKIIKLLNDWLIFWVTQEKDEVLGHRLIWNIFENIDGDIENIFDMPWIIGLESKEKGMFVSTWGDWKKWLLKMIVSEEDKKRKHREIKELIPAKEDTIELVGDFILTSRTTHTQSSMGNENKINHISVYDETITHKHIHEPYYNLRVLFGSSRDMELTTQRYLLLRDKNTVSFCRYDEEKKKFHKIEWLQDIKIPNSSGVYEKIPGSIGIYDLLDGKITYLEFTDSQKNGLYSLDKKTWELNRWLATMTVSEWVRDLSIVKKWGDMIEISYLLVSKTSMSYPDYSSVKKSVKKLFWLKDGELYSIWYFSKLKWRWNALVKRDFNEYTFQSMQPYLRKIDWPIRL